MHGRRYIAIWWLTLIVSISHAQNNADTPDQQSETQQQAPPSQIIVQQHGAAPPYYQVDCERPSDHDAADLCEQRRMAKAAEDSVWWTRFQAWIGALGFIGVLITLGITGQGTRAASRQVRLSRHALVDTDRAFVYPKETLWGVAKDAKTQQVQYWLISIKWLNSGNTPTRHLHLFFAKEMRDTVLSDEFEFAQSAWQHIPALIAPHETLESNQLVMSLEEIEAVINGSKVLYLWGWAEYDDVFEGTPRHRTEFCHRWILSGNPRKNDAFSQRYTLHHKHNGADDECEYPIKTTSPKEMG